MLQRKPSGTGKITSWGLLVGIEIEDGETTAEQVAARVQDALTWMEGVGAVQIEVLGEITVYPEGEETKQ